MTTLRTAAKQALEALEEAASYTSCPTWSPSMTKECEAAAAALRAALTEDALQKFTEVSQEIEAALAEPVQQGCDHCNHPLYAAIKCRVCGRVTEPVQEPVAWQWLDTAHFRKKIPAGATPAHWRPLFTTPSQSKPLTEEEIKRIDASTHFHESPDWSLRFARAIERAHGITS